MSFCFLEVIERSSKTPPLLQLYHLSHLQQTLLFAQKEKKLPEEKRTKATVSITDFHIMENLPFLCFLLFPYKEHTTEAHAKGERKQQQEDDIFVPDFYTQWKKNRLRHGRCPGIFPASDPCWQRQPRGASGTSLPSHRELLLLGPSSRAKGGPAMLKATPTFCSTLSVFFLRATSLDVNFCFQQAPALCQHIHSTNTLGQGLCLCSGHRESQHGAVLLAG